MVLRIPNRKVQRTPVQSLDHLGFHKGTSGQGPMERQKREEPRKHCPWWDEPQEPRTEWTLVSIEGCRPPLCGGVVCQVFLEIQEWKSHLGFLLELLLYIFTSPNEPLIRKTPFSCKHLSSSPTRANVSEGPCCQSYTVIGKLFANAKYDLCLV